MESEKTLFEKTHKELISWVRSDEGYVGGRDLESEVINFILSRGYTVARSKKNPKKFIISVSVAP
jgi:hypothetical protein